MGCGGSKPVVEPTLKNRSKTLESDDDGKTFMEKIKDIQINEDPNECIADLRLTRKKRELKAKGFLRKVMNRGKTPEPSEEESDEDGEVNSKKGSEKSSKKSKENSIRSKSASEGSEQSEGEGDKSKGDEKNEKKKK